MAQMLLNQMSDWEYVFSGLLEESFVLHVFAKITFPNVSFDLGGLSVFHCFEGVMFTLAGHRLGRSQCGIPRYTPGSY